jgi:hypothetical protein
VSAGYIVRATTIGRVWIALGGDPPKRGRARAFYRDGTNPQAVSLNDSKGCWFDHRDRIGGGMLDLINHVLGCGTAGALRWLSSFTGIPLEERSFSGAERREYGRRCDKAERLAQDVADFEYGLELFLEERRGDVTTVVSWLLDHDIDPGDLFGLPASELLALNSLDPDSLVQGYLETPEPVRCRFRDAGWRRREEAEQITRAIVALIAQADSRKAAA